MNTQAEMLSIQLQEWHIGLPGLLYALNKKWSMDFNRLLGTYMASLTPHSLLLISKF